MATSEGHLKAWPGLLQFFELSEGNMGYVKTWPGLLKLFELIIGAVVVGLLGYYYAPSEVSCIDSIRVYTGNPDIFLLLMAVTFLIGTFCLLLAILISASASNSIYELIYHSVAGILLLAASVNKIVESRYWGNQYDAYMAASLMGLVNTVLYFISAVLAHRSYGGI